MKRFRAFVVFGVLAWMLADMQMNYGGSNVHAQWFSTGKFKQTIMMSPYDIMRISHAIEGGKYKRRADMSLGVVDCHLGVLVLIVWVY